jgi:hypothetical protein
MLVHPTSSINIASNLSAASKIACIPSPGPAYIAAGPGIMLEQKLFIKSNALSAPAVLHPVGTDSVCAFTAYYACIIGGSHTVDPLIRFVQSPLFMRASLGGVIK